VPPAARESLRRALLQARASAEGRALLVALATEAFERGDAQDYEGQGVLLRGTWRAGALPADR